MNVVIYHVKAAQKEIRENNIERINYMKKYRMELIDTCSMRRDIIFECKAESKEEAIEKMEARFSGGFCVYGEIKEIME